ncbi:MAG: tyrosine-type recombinase/integrase [Acidimicrobiales bacterium]
MVRGRGEGSLYRRGDGRWVAQVELERAPNGRRRYTRAVRATKTEALAALRALQRRPAGAQTDTRTLAAYLDWWGDNVLADAVADDTVKQSTADDYRWIIGRYVAPHLGRHQLRALTPDHVQAWLRLLASQGLSPRTRQYARSVLVRALRWATQTGKVDRNVAALVEGPRMSGRAKIDDTLTADEAQTVLDAAAGDRLEALAVIALRLGLRRGEALALRWDDVDLDHATLTVAGTLKRQPGGALYIDTPKTAAGNRTIPLLAVPLAALTEHRRLQDAERLAAGPLWHDSGHVFTRHDGRPLQPASASAWWKKLCERAGIGRRRFHASRHTCATLLLEADVPLEVVSAILGHANLSVTADIYAKVGQDAKRRALSKLDSGPRPL